MDPKRLVCFLTQKVGHTPRSEELGVGLGLKTRKVILLKQLFTSIVLGNAPSHPGSIQGALTKEILNLVRFGIKSCRIFGSRCTSNLILFYKFYAKLGIFWNASNPKVSCVGGTRLFAEK